MKLEQVNIKSLLRALFQESQYLQRNLNETISYIHWPITTCFDKKNKLDQKQTKTKGKNFFTFDKVMYYFDS